MYKTGVFHLVYAPWAWHEQGRFKAAAAAILAVSGAASKRAATASSEEIASAAATVLGALGTTSTIASVTETQAATELLQSALAADPNVLNDPQVKPHFALHHTRVRVSCRVLCCSSVSPPPHGPFTRS